VARIGAGARRPTDHHDRRARECGQIGDLITELAAVEAGNQVDEGLALHRRDQLPVEDEPVSPHGNARRTVLTCWVANR
jgi:hypothetical protein